jgi:hypothetical protein
MVLVSHFVIGKALTVLDEERREFAVKWVSWWAVCSSGKFLIFKRGVRS